MLSQFLSGDQNILNVRAVVQYSIAEPADYLFRSADVDLAVANAVEAALERQISTRAVDEVLTTEKIAIQEEVRRQSQELIDRHGLGVVLSTVNIRSVTPPAEAADAFRDVASARADSARIVNEAEGYANDILPRARGQAQQMLSASHGYRERRIQQAQGDAARFEKLASEYARNPEVTRSRLFLETMEEILPRLRKTIVDEGGNLDLKHHPAGQQPPVIAAMSKDAKAQAVTVTVIVAGLAIIAWYQGGFERLDFGGSDDSGFLGPRFVQAGRTEGRDLLHVGRGADGLVDDYLDCYAGQMERTLRQSMEEMGPERFSEFLRERNRDIKGIAMNAPEESGNEAQVRVEYVYADRNEVQQIFLERAGDIWKIARVSEIQRVETPVPYGTPVY